MVSAKPAAFAFSHSEVVMFVARRIISGSLYEWPFFLQLDNFMVPSSSPEIQESFSTNSTSGSFPSLLQKAREAKNSDC